VKKALLVSSKDPFEDFYLPEGKWTLFRERIDYQRTALWGINFWLPDDQEVLENAENEGVWVYIGISGTQKVDAKMRARGFVPSPAYPKRAALSDDPRRLPRCALEEWQMYIEIDLFEPLRKPLTKEELKNRDGKKITRFPQGSYYYIQDPDS
jgi:hypothetical protein